MAKHDESAAMTTAAGMSRRRFLGAGVAGGAALAGGGLGALVPSAARAGGHPPAGEAWLEATVPQLRAQMAAGALTSRALTRGYLARIEALNPLLGAVIEVNPHAVHIAAQRDLERRLGRVRGRLHGIPVLVKDNVATDDATETTAGSLALVGSRVRADARVVARLREEGAVILGKANLSEWANFRGFAPFNGWSARGGFTRNPYRLDFDPCGSSSGSAVAAAASLCAVAVGTETDGSILCPAGNNLVVGLKPTVGLVSQRGIIPIAASQDTAGPIVRSVTDAAIMLAVMQSPSDGMARHALPAGYRQFLQRGALRGRRIGVDRRYFTPEFGGEPDLVAVAERGLDAMDRLGATLIDTDTGDPGAWFDAEFTVLLSEFKVQIAQYLGRLRGTTMRTLADLIAFNAARCHDEMPFHGQELFELAEATSGDLSDPAYRDARALCLRLTRDEGIDAAMRRDRLDAIVAPTYSFASSVAAVAGYPSLSLPVGLSSEGRPAGLWFYGGFLQEPQLLAYAYDLEQELQPRRPPEFMGSVPPDPPPSGLCATASAAPVHPGQDAAAARRDRAQVWAC